MQKFSYHTHTDLSDGRDSLENMLKKAVSLGWEQIGISDHMIIHKDIKKSTTYKTYMVENFGSVYHDSFEKALSVYQRNVEYIRNIAKKFPIDVFIGFEVDYFTYNGWEDEFRSFIKQIDYDYLLNGNHYFFDDDCRILVDISSYNKIDDSLKTDSYENYHKRHYQTIQKAVGSGLFNILAHLDYAKKLKQHETYPCNEEKLKIIDILSQKSVAAEVSTKGLRKVNSFYPDEFLIKQMIDKNVAIVISDDAHKVDELGFCFDKAEEKLKELNCKNRFILK